MDAVVNETKVRHPRPPARRDPSHLASPHPSPLSLQFWGARLSLQSGFFISYDVEPFLSSLLSHAPDGSSAYPPSRAQGLLPLNIYYAYLSDLADDAMRSAARQSATQLEAVVAREGQDVGGAALYNNYAIFDTPLERMYGGNVARLAALREQYDPEGVMALAGGWKF